MVLYCTNPLRIFYFSKSRHIKPRNPKFHQKAISVFRVIYLKSGMFDRFSPESQVLWNWHRCGYRKKKKRCDMSEILFSLYRELRKNAVKGNFLANKEFLLSKYFHENLFLLANTRDPKLPESSKHQNLKSLAFIFSRSLH